MATDLNTQIKINNQSFVSLDSPVRITASTMVLSWDFDKISITDVDETDGTSELLTTGGQLEIEISIADNDVNLGTTSFLGNYVSTSMTSWTSRIWKYIGVPLERGEVYYGQLRLVNVVGEESEFATFSFSVNNAPVASNTVLSPVSPTTSDGITLTYSYFDLDGDIEGNSFIRWFKNGVYQRNLDGQSFLKSSYMQIGDVWYADVLPNDGFEYGARMSSNSAQVVRSLSSVVSVKISPENPNENDILKADYKLDILSIDDIVRIRWFVNNVIQSDFNDNQFMRYDSSPGDVVRYEANTESGTTFVTSEEVTIVASDFSVYDIRIDGSSEPLEVSTTTPNIIWKTSVPDGREINYTHIQIGTFYEASNIYDEIFEINKDNFTIPANILDRGVDYYVSISVSDTVNFGVKTSSHFRINGSRWDASVSNSTGWTIETIYLIQDVEDYDPSKYQLLRISDGAFFAEIRLFNEKIAFVSEDIISVDVDTSGRNLLTIAGVGNDVKIYLDRELVLDATGIFTQSTSDKRLELGNATGQTFEFTYKYLYYTTSGAYYPGESPEYSQTQFSTFLSLEDSEIVALKGYTEYVLFAGEEDKKLVDTKVFASNPNDEDESGSVYSIVSADKYKVGTVPKTYSPTNKIRKSPDGKTVTFAHAKGASIITGYLINPFNFEIDFTTVDSDGEFPLPNNNGWELVQNTIWEAAYFDTNGLNINTIIKRE